MMRQLLAIGMVGVALGCSTNGFQARNAVAGSSADATAHTAATSPQSPHEGSSPVMTAPLSAVYPGSPIETSPAPAYPGSPVEALPSDYPDTTANCSGTSCTTTVGIGSGVATGTYTPPVAPSPPPTVVVAPAPPPVVAPAPAPAPVVVVQAPPPAPVQPPAAPTCWCTLGPQVAADLGDIGPASSIAPNTTAAEAYCTKWAANAFLAGKAIVHSNFPVGCQQR